MAYQTRESVGGSFPTQFGATQTANFDANVFVINDVDCSSGNVKASLPAAASASGKVCRIHISASDPSYEVNVYAAAGIDGANNQYIQAPGGMSEFMSNGTNWTWLKRGNKYIPRAVDPAAADFTTANLTDDGNFYELDLSSILPNAAYGRAVNINYYAQGSGASRSFVIKPVGNSNGKYRLYAIGSTGGAGGGGQGMMECDSAGKLQYRASGTCATLDLIVLGWMVDV